MPKFTYGTDWMPNTQLGPPKNQMAMPNIGGYQPYSPPTAPAPIRQPGGWMYGNDNSQISPLMQQEREHWQAGTLNNIFPLWQQQIGRLGDADQLSEMYRQRFNQSLDPGHMASLAGAFRNRANAGADEEGQRMASSLRSQGIYGQDAAANLYAMNNAATRSNEYEAGLYDPSNLGRNALAGMQANSPESMMSLLGLMQAMTGGNVDLQRLMMEESANKGKNGLGGVLGQLLGSMGGFGTSWAQALS